MNKYIRKKETISGRLHDELVMMDIDKGKYFSLNPIATRIWDLLEQALTLEELCSLLMMEFEVEAEHCRADVEAHLKEMQKLKLVLVMKEPRNME